MAFVDYMSNEMGEPKWNLAHTEAHFDCPFCTDSRKRLRFNTIKMLCICFNCDWRGNAVKFVKEYHRLSKWSEAFDIVNFYEEFRPLPTDIYEEVFDKLFIEGQDIDIEKKPILLPKDYRLLSKSTSPRDDIYRKYAKSRLLTERQLELHGVGYSPEGSITIIGQDGKKEIPLTNRLIVQTFNDADEPIYWVARSIFGDTIPKVLNPAGDVVNINKSDVIFNLNNAKKTGCAVVTEGIFDATTAGDFGVCLFGKTISMIQLLLLINAGLDVIYVMLDPDAIENAVKIADLLSKHFSEVYLCHLDGGDPNEIGREGVLRALKEAERYSALTAIKYRI